MGKRANTVLFLLGATAFNLFVTLLSFLLFLVIYTFFFASRLPESLVPWMIPTFFVASILTSWLIYRFVMKFFLKKIDVQKYFAPVYKSGKPPEET